SGKEEVLIYVLMEHKSAPDPTVAFQLLRYLVRIWDDWRKQSKTRLLPPVIPLVVYHGSSAWNVPIEFITLFGEIPGELRTFLPSFNFALVDLGRLEDEKLTSNARLRIYLMAFKYNMRDDLPERIGDILKDASVLEVVDVICVLEYINNGR